MSAFLNVFWHGTVIYLHGEKYVEKTHLLRQYTSICVPNHQFSSGKGLLAYDIVFLAMLYLDSAVLLMFAALRTLFALCAFCCIRCHVMFYMCML